MPSNWATYGPTGWCGAPGYTQPVCSSAMPDICSTENSCLGTGGKWCTVSAPSGTLGFCKSTACPTEQTTEVLRTFVFDKSGIAVIPLDDTKNIYFPLTGTGYIEVPLLDGTIYRYSANPADPPQPLPFPDFTGNIKIENSVIIHGYGQKRTIIVPNNPLGPVLVPMEGGGGFLVALKDSISGRVSGYYSMKGTVTMGEGNMIYSYKNNCIVSTTKKFSAYWKDFGSQLDSFINIKCPAMP
ncbi:MAG: hypothetical protein HY362_04430 [Candidatus Aenigmarchaeota archaeon]|nr:hypothetical protein [Candidatus Aenigmarchaeota archaeon]